MIVRTLFFFAILLCSVLLGIQLHADPGYLLIALNHWTIETTLWVGLFALLCLFISAHLTLQLCAKLFRSPSTLSRWYTKRLAQKAQVITNKGLIEYSEGYWEKAQNHLIAALPNTDTPLLNYLTAARAAQKMGDSTLRDHYLREAQQSMPEAKIAVELTQAQLQLANHQWEQALATLRHLQDLAPKHPYVLKLLMQLYEQVRDWPQLIALLPQLQKHKIIAPQLLQSIERNAYLQTMIDMEKQHQQDAVTHLYNTLPKNIRNHHEIVIEYSQFLLKNEQYTDAEAVLRSALRREFNNRCIELYCQLPSNEQQLIFAESLLKKNPHSASLFLCLGHQAVKQQLWGKAKSYLEQSLALQPMPKAYMELGLLYEQIQDPVQASECYKKGLDLVT